MRGRTQPRVARLHLAPDGVGYLRGRLQALHPRRALPPFWPRIRAAHATPVPPDTPAVPAAPPQEPLGWELWAFGELNCALSAHFADVDSFDLQAVAAFAQGPAADVLAAFLASVPQGPASRLVTLLLRRPFAGCAEAELVRYRFTCPPCLEGWAARYGVDPQRATLFALTGVDTSCDDACTLYVPHIPPLRRPPPRPPRGEAPQAGGEAPQNNDESVAMLWLDHAQQQPKQAQVQARYVQQQEQPLFAQDVHPTATSSLSAGEDVHPLWGVPPPSHVHAVCSMEAASRAQQASMA